MPAAKVHPGLLALISSGPEWLTAAVDDYLERDTGGNRIDPGWFHASSLGTNCDARLALEFLGISARPGSIDAKLRRIFDNGHARDCDWKGYLLRSKLSIVVPTHKDCPDCGSTEHDGRHICIPSLRLRGSFDDHIKNPATGKTYIFEFKTKNDALWKALKAPEPDHNIQVHPYMVAKGETEAIIVYENKNTQELKPFLIPYQAELWEQTIARLKNILSQLANDYTPDKMCGGRCDFDECNVASFPALVDAYRKKAGLA